MTSPRTAKLPRASDIGGTQQSMSDGGGSREGMCSQAALSERCREGGGQAGLLGRATAREDEG